MLAGAGHDLRRNPRHELQVDRHVEVPAPALEVLGQLPATGSVRAAERRIRGLTAAASSPSTRRDPRPLERDPDHTRRGRRDQQVAERTVQRCGTRRRPDPRPRHAPPAPPASCSAPARGPRTRRQHDIIRGAPPDRSSVRSDPVTGVRSRVHHIAPSVRALRSAAIPSAALRRAAAGELPISSPTSS